MTRRTLPNASSAACALAAALLLCLPACNGHDGTADAGAGVRGGTAADADLPAPEGAIGSVTGMPPHPGPGTAPIQTVGAPASPAAASGDADDVDVDASDAIEIVEVQAPLPESRFAAAAPVIIVPDVPVEPTAATVGPPPAGPATAPPRREPVGTEGATESTTIILEPADGTGD